jgi:hypothetical protein
VAKQDKVTELQQGKVIPLNALLVVRLWHRKADQLAARCASVKNHSSRWEEQSSTTQLFLRMLASSSIRRGPDGPLAPIGRSIYPSKTLTWRT